MKLSKNNIKVLLLFVFLGLIIYAGFGTIFESFANRKCIKCPANANPTSLAGKKKCCPGTDICKKGLCYPPN